MKGQLFTTDVLASVLILTVIVAFTTWEFEQIYNRSSDTQYDRMNSLANDISQMAVKSILASRNPGNVILTNSIDASRWDLLKGNMSEMIPAPYGYEASINEGFPQLPISGNGGCPPTKADITIVRRLVYFNGISENIMPVLTIKVCI